MRILKNVYWHEASEYRMMKDPEKASSVERRIEEVCCERGGGNALLRRCGWTDQLGLCELTPIACPKDAVYASVSYDGSQPKCRRVGTLALAHGAF